MVGADFSMNSLYYVFLFACFLVGRGKRVGGLKIQGLKWCCIFHIKINLLLLKFFLTVLKHFKKDFLINMNSDCMHHAKHKHMGSCVI